MIEGRDEYSDLFKHPRGGEDSGKVVATIDLSQGGTMDLWKRLFCIGPSLDRPVRDIVCSEGNIGYEYLIGFLDPIECTRPVYIYTTTCYLNGFPVVLWENTCRYVDFSMLEEWVSKEYTNARVHADLRSTDRVLDHIRHLTQEKMSEQERSLMPATTEESS